MNDHGSHKRTLLREMFQRTRWHQFYEAFCDFDDFAVMVVVSHILNQWGMTDNEWVPVSNESLARRYRKDIQKIQRIVRKIKRVPFLRHRLVGVPPVSHYSVKQDVLEAFIANYRDRDLKGIKNDSTNSIESDRIEVSNSIKNERIGSIKNDRNNIEEEREEHQDELPLATSSKGEVLFEYKLAKKLYHLLATNRRLMAKVNQSTLHRWSTELMKIKRHYQASEDEIKSVWKWYKTNFNGQYTPKCNSAKSFVIKWPNIKDAMERDAKAQAKETKRTAGVHKTKTSEWVPQSNGTATRRIDYADGYTVETRKPDGRVLTKIYNHKESK